MNSLTVQQFVVVWALAAIVSADEYTCYQCSSSDNPSCGESITLGHYIPQTSGCICCTKSYDGTYWSRGCSTNGVHCFPLYGSDTYSCFDNLCNKVPTTSSHVLITAFLAAIGLAACFLY